MKNEITNEERNRIISLHESRTRKHYLSEQGEITSKDESTEIDFCEEAEYNEQQALDHLKVLQDLKDMVKKFDSIISECNLDSVVIFTMMFSKIVDKWDQLLQLDIDGIDMEEYINHLKDKYKI